MSNKNSDNCCEVDKNGNTVDLADNRRIRTTKKMLKEALIDILSKKPLDKISIKEICEQADVNRTTFYKYYTDEYSLLLEIEKDFFELINVKMQNSRTTILALLEVLKDNESLSRILFLNNTSLAKKLFVVPAIQKAMSDKMTICISNDKREKLFYFIFCGGFALTLDWIRSNFAMPTKDLASLLLGFMETLLRK